ncbi:unnamed protein product [Adineta ricciae]|uniref:Uncharacterized protein n=1 Tax=Adineta ricciae TaxID=249248 RepID=A0A813PVJ9_ADIRI|nr:unnamed protein product [Adineta ricciae]
MEMFPLDEIINLQSLYHQYYRIQITMTKHLGFCFLFIPLIYLNKVSSTRINNDKQSIGSLSGHNDPDYFVANRQLSHDTGEDEYDYRKRSLTKKKWARLFERSKSRYPIAFPALLLSRRWIKDNK